MSFEIYILHSTYVSFIYYGLLLTAHYSRFPPTNTDAIVGGIRAIQAIGLVKLPSSYIIALPVIIFIVHYIGEYFCRNYSLNFINLAVTVY